MAVAVTLGLGCRWSFVHLFHEHPGPPPSARQGCASCPGRRPRSARRRARGRLGARRFGARGCGRSGGGAGGDRQGHPATAGPAASGHRGGRREAGGGRLGDVLHERLGGRAVTHVRCGRFGRRPARGGTGRRARRDEVSAVRGPVVDRARQGDRDDGGATARGAGRHGAGTDRDLTRGGGRADRPRAVAQGGPPGAGAGRAVERGDRHA